MVDEMIDHAIADLPNECCGLISGKDGTAAKLFRTGNAEKSPFRYSIEPLDLKRALEEMDAADTEVLVVYHSHVASPAYPSQTDVRLAHWPGVEPPIEIFPGAYYVLVSLQDREKPDVRGFTIRGGQVDEVELAIT
jgi:proteasome lid subunit RPN8/RPN11